MRESILKSASLEKLIATSNEDYIKKAAYYANNINELEKLEKSYDNIEKTLFDTKQFTKDFSNAIDKKLTVVNNNYGKKMIILECILAMMALYLL